MRHLQRDGRGRADRQTDSHIEHGIKVGNKARNARQKKQKLQEKNPSGTFENNSEGDWTNLPSIKLKDTVAI